MSGRIDADRLWADLMALGEITEPRRPYTRRAFSPEFDAGRAWLDARMRAAGLAARVDVAGNLVGRREGRRPRAAAEPRAAEPRAAEPQRSALIVGSHSDSVAAGGRFDGMVGVVAGIEIARALAEEDRQLEHPLEVVDFLAEEPNEFGLSCVGSRGITGHLSAAQLELRSPSGETLAQAVARVGGDPRRLPAPPRGDIGAAFELHIEQGPVLERERIDVGIVTAIVGITRLELEFRGSAGHAGTTPMPGRRDALVAAARMVCWVRDTALELAGAGRGHFVATVGVIEALPGGSNVIPRSARLVIDARSEDRRLMEEFRAMLDVESSAVAQSSNVERARLACLSDNPPAACDRALQAVLATVAAARRLSVKAMASGAGHDMAFISQVAPAAMLFIPCKDGRSHTPEEWATAEAVAAGCEVLLEALLEVDRQSAAGGVT